MIKKEKEKKMYAGSGQTEHKFSKDKMYLGIDFSGNRINDSSGQIECFRNDASILFFVGDSYYLSYMVIKKQLEECINQEMRQDAEKLILPLYFNYRHYVEVEIKAMIVALTEKSYKCVHNVLDLWKDLYNIISNLKYNDSDVYTHSYCTQQQFEDSLGKLMTEMKELDKLIESYFGDEPAVEYYRYIFDSNCVLMNSRVELDFNGVTEQQLNISIKISSIKMELRNIIYIYFAI